MAKGKTMKGPGVFSIRLPPEINNKLRLLAKKEDRSLTNMSVRLFRIAFTQIEKGEAVA